VVSGARARATAGEATRRVELTPPAREATTKLDARRTLAQARGLKERLAEEKPAQQRAILKRSAAEIEALTRKLDTLGPEDTKRALKTLSSIAEEVGQENAHLLTDPMARALPDVVRGHAQNAGELGRALRDNVREGRGALLGAALAVSLQGNRVAGSVPAGTLPPQTVRGLVTSAVRQGLEEARARFEGAADATDRVNAKAARALDSVRGFDFTSEELARGVDAIRDEHRDELEAYDAAAGAYAASLDGAAYLHRKLDADLGGKGLREAATRALENVPRMHDSPLALERIARSVERESDGFPSFLAAGESVAKRLQKGRKWLDNAANTVVKAGGIYSARALAKGDVRSAERFLAGLDKHSRFVGVEPGALEKLRGLLRRRSTGELSPELLTKEWSKTTRSMKGVAGRAPRGRITGALNVFGAVAGAATLARDLSSMDELDKVERLRAVVDGADLGADATAGVMQALGHAAPRLLIKGSAVAGGIGAAFDFYDAARAFRSGDETTGALSLVSGAGGVMVAGATLAGTGVGVALGAGLIATSVVVAYVVNKRRQKRAEKRAEEGFGRFLEGVGLSPRAAKRLRDLDGQHRSAWGALRAAARQLGVSPRSFLEHLTQRVADGDLREIVDTAEEVRRDDDGRPVARGTSPVPWGKPGTVEELVAWLRERGLAPAAARPSR
jgi:hypothetical protein